MAAKNPKWSAPRIHGELQKLGFNVAERTVARYLQRGRRRSDGTGTWRVFLENHRGALAGFDFFTVPTATFQLLYCLFVIDTGAASCCISM
jgi:hypothetical protein